MKNDLLEKEIFLIKLLLREKLAEYGLSVQQKEDLFKRVVDPKVAWWKSFVLSLRQFAKSLAVVVLIVAGSLTTAYAYSSPNVNSESSLYFLKMAMEDVEYFFAFSEEAKVEKLLRFNERRQQEIDVLERGGQDVEETNLEILENLDLIKVLIDYREVADPAVLVKGPMIKREVVLREAAPYNEKIPVKDEVVEVEPVDVREPVVKDVPVNNEVPVDDVVPVCSDQCSPGDLDQCDARRVKSCGDYNADGCYEWGACYAPNLPGSVDLRYYEWEI